MKKRDDTGEEGGHGVVVLIILLIVILHNLFPQHSTAKCECIGLARGYHCCEMQDDYQFYPW